MHYGTTKKYYKNNKINILEQCRKYYEDNKKDILVKRKQYNKTEKGKQVQKRCNNKKGVRLVKQDIKEVILV